jgi:hypothetical protein
MSEPGFTGLKDYQDEKMGRGERRFETGKSYDYYMLKIINHA